MIKHFHDYIWREGIPYGIGFIEDPSQLHTPTYKIVMDPYRKRISIEKYSKGLFEGIVYDSALLDFRHLKKPEQMAWEKTTQHDDNGSLICLIRNQDDRLLFFETYLFESELCRECRVKSVHGYPLSTHRMFYTALNDPFNGVILYDCNEHPVMMKRYDINPETGEFTTLLEETWNPNAKDNLSVK